MKKSNWKLGLVALLIMIFCIPKPVNAYSLEKDDYDWTDDGSSWIVKKCEYRSPKNAMTVYFKKSSNYTKGSLREFNLGDVYIDSKDTSFVRGYWAENAVQVLYEYADNTKNYFSSPECPYYVFLQYTGSDTGFSIIDNDNELKHLKELGEGGNIYTSFRTPKYISCKSCSKMKAKYSADLINKKKNETAKIKIMMDPESGEVILSDNDTKYYDTDLKHQEWFWDYGNSRDNSLRFSENIFHYLYLNETAGAGFNNVYLFHQPGVNYHITLTKDDPNTYGKSLDDENLWTNYGGDTPARNQCNEYSEKVQKEYDKMWDENQQELTKLKESIKNYVPQSSTIVEKIEDFNTSLTKINKSYNPNNILKKLRISSECTMATDYAHLTSSSDEKRKKLVNEIKDLLENLKKNNVYQSLPKDEKKKVDMLLDGMTDSLDSIVNATDESWLLGEEGTIDCEGAEERALFQQIQRIFDMIKIIVPIILIVMGALDFGKAVLASDEKAIKQAQGRFMKRAIVAVCIFLLPTIIEIIFNMLNENSGTINVDNPLCGIK